LYCRGMSWKSSYVSAFKVYDGKSPVLSFVNDEIDGWNGDL